MGTPVIMAFVSRNRRAERTACEGRQLQNKGNAEMEEERKDEGKNLERNDVTDDNGGVGRNDVLFLLSGGNLIFQRAADDAGNGSAGVAGGSIGYERRRKLDERCEGKRDLRGDLEPDPDCRESNGETGK